MTVEQYGARLLGDVQEESLHDLLKTLQTTLNPQPRNVLGWEPADELLELFRYHQPTSPARQPGYVHEVVGNDDVYDDEGSIRLPLQPPRKSASRPPIIQITSSASDTGKTSLLYHLTTIALLPALHGGKSTAVVWVDTDHRFSALRLSTFITTHLSKHSSALSTTDIDNLVTSSLQHIHIIRPTSSSSLLRTLHHLPAYLFSPTNPSSSLPLSLIVLDSATSFQHQDRLDSEIARLTNPSLTNPTPSTTSQIITALRTLQAQFSCTVLFTTTTPSPKPIPKSATSTLPAGLQAVDQRISPWTSFATLTLHVSHLPVQNFGHGMSLDDCLRDREKRQEAVRHRRVKVGASVEAAEQGREIWPRGVVEVVKGMVGGGVWGMRLCEEGLVMDRHNS